MAKIKYLIFLLLFFPLSVKAISVDNGAMKLGTRSCVYSNGVLLCSNNTNYSTYEFKNSVQPFSVGLAKNRIITNMIFDYSSSPFTNNTGTDIYLGMNDYRTPFYPTSNTCKVVPGNSANIRIAKNMKPISCSYEDSQGNKTDCLADMYLHNNLLTLEDYTINDENVSVPITQKIPFILKIPNNAEVYNLAILFGGYATYNGPQSQLYSGFGNVNTSPFYMDYPIESGCTFSSVSSTNFDISLFKQYYSLRQYSQSIVNNSFTPIDTTTLNNEVQYYTDNSQTLKDLALQDSLIGYDGDSQSSDIVTMTNDLEDTLSSKMSGNITIFNDFLALPINLLNENAVRELTFGDNPGVSGDCLQYDSNFLTGNNIHVGAQPIDVKLPFVSNHLRLTCSDLDILSPYNKVGGSFYAGSNVNGWGTNFTGLDHTIGPIYHILIDGVLSYWFIISLFRFCKEVLDPEDNSLEVLDL